jgi:hypothetical protein
MQNYKGEDMAKYTLLQDGTYKNNETGWTGIRPGNWMFEDVQAWLDAGNTPDPEFTEKEIEDNQWNDLRINRNELLKKTDFMMTQDYYSSILTHQEQIDLTVYRQELRDLPSKISDIYNINWPKKPQIVIDQGF